MLKNLNRDDHVEGIGGWQIINCSVDEAMSRDDVSIGDLCESGLRNVQTDQIKPGGDQ